MRHRPYVLRERYEKTRVNEEKEASDDVEPREGIPSPKARDADKDAEGAEDYEKREVWEVTYGIR